MTLKYTVKGSNEWLPIVESEKGNFRIGPIINSTEEYFEFKGTYLKDGKDVIIRRYNTVVLASSENGLKWENRANIENPS